MQDISACANKRDQIQAHIDQFRSILEAVERDIAISMDLKDALAAFDR